MYLDDPATFDRFNPTLVRLRRSGSMPLRSSTSQFQSHAGSIEALQLLMIVVGFYLFQSHAGSIEASESHLGCDSILMFQSHAGSIEAHLRARFVKANSLVSIPRWFD